MGTRHLLALLAATAFTSIAACGSAPTPDEPWAQPAVELFEEMGGSYARDDHFEVARFFSAGGSLDARAWGLGQPATDPLEVAELVSDFGFNGEAPHGPMDVETRRVFVGRESAAVEYLAWQPMGYITWIQLYAFGDESRVNSRIYSENLQTPWGPPRYPRDHQLYDRYITLWSGERSADATTVYVAEAELRDGMSGETWSGSGEIADAIDDSPPIDPGPFPRVWGYHVPRRTELLAYVQTAGECPRLELRRWVVEDDLIVDETVFAHVASVRRCDGSAGDGWWDDFEPLPTTDVLAAESYDLGDRAIELVNATPMHVDFAGWLFERFTAGGLETPDVAAIWFPPHVDCPVHGSFALASDDRYGGRASVALCFEARELAGRLDGWSDTAVRFGLHELGHVWMYDHLDDEMRGVFTERAGLDAWRGSEVLWGERGVEHAAETIGWGVAGDGRARYDIEPRPACSELLGRYELLTGLQAVTTCGGNDR